MKHAKLLLLLSVVSVLAAGLRSETVLSPVPAVANLRVAAIQVRVTPDRRDWTYALGETPRFTIAVTADNEPIDHAVVTYQVGPELMPAEKKSATVPLEGLVVNGPVMKEPGFVKCIATVEVAGTTYRGLATAACTPDKIVPYPNVPADFDEFWANGREELSKIPLEARLTLQPEACTDTVNVYHVSLRMIGQGWAGPAHVYGILCEPKAPGHYPAVLKVPGAGVRPYFGDAELAGHGVIVLEIGIHGIPVNQPKQVYDDLLATALNGYWFFNLDNRDTYYYRRVYLGCLRADDFLVSRPAWDGKNLVVMGASQGGLLSIVTAALDPRVTALSATHPAMCDLLGDMRGRAGGWPHPFKPNDDGSPSPHVTEAKIKAAGYYDAVNFARRLKVPGFYIWGYNDEVCPPTSTFAMYNVVTAPKQLAVELEQGHAYPPEQWRAINTWLFQQLGLK